MKREIDSLNEQAVPIDSESFYTAVAASFEGIRRGVTAAACKQRWLKLVKEKPPSGLTYVHCSVLQVVTN